MGEEFQTPPGAITGVQQAPLLYVNSYSGRVSHFIGDPGAALWGVGCVWFHLGPSLGAARLLVAVALYAFYNIQKKNKAKTKAVPVTITNTTPGGRDIMADQASPSLQVIVLVSWCCLS